MLMSGLVERDHQLSYSIWWSIPLLSCLLGYCFYPDIIMSSLLPDGNIFPLAPFMIKTFRGPVSGNPRVKL
ncbi:hypothetical protein BDV32DRAFT_122318 [Aspergillus pseudonomiae]|nr:hypothetical protein BDV32DRAFT_122318 [Aspergillus pseudonomiae]